MPLFLIRYSDVSIDSSLTAGERNLVFFINARCFTYAFCIAHLTHV